MKTKHDEILKRFTECSNVHSVSECLETPNKYDTNISHFSVKYDYEDSFNYTIFDFNINWDNNTVFVRLEGYFNFDSIDDLMETLNNYFKYQA